MSDENNKRPSIFSKLLEAGSAVLDSQIHKAKNSIVMNQSAINDDELFYSKTITEDPSYAIHAAGWKEKPHRLQNGHLKQMSMKDSVIAGVIQTRQNHVSNHSKLVDSERERGFMVVLRNEKELLEEIKERLKKDMASGAGDKNKEDGDQEDESVEAPPAEVYGAKDSTITKAEGDGMVDEDSLEDTSQTEVPDKDGKSDDEVEEYNWELERKAREELDAQFKDAKKKVTDYILNCGEVENRPFSSKRWNFDSALRAWVRDTLTYDLYGTEVVPNKLGKPHHWFPVDGGTIKYSSARLKDYKEVAENFLNLNILYPEKEVKAIENSKVLELDPKVLDKDAYKWVQVVRGKIERAYTDDELKVGMRNPTTDIYNNGYGVSELELVVSLVTGHLNAEFYNQAYFTQGFSAKGILHIKAAINRRKLETVRQQWQHMLRGAKNSFQTPIFAGVDEVDWIPLTQNHNDIGFEGWMRYLVRMICSIYQIDPHEIGIGFKDEGAGGGISGDNTKQKIDESKDKGLYPLLRHLESYINESIIKPYDDRFAIQFTGMTSETAFDAVERQKKESEFKKTVNEIRAEDGLPPLPGMDDVILSPVYMTWYNAFSKKAEENAEAMMIDQGLGAVAEGEADAAEFDRDQEMGAIDADKEAAVAKKEQKIKKSFRKKPKHKQVKIEIYKLEE